MHLVYNLCFVQSKCWKTKREGCHYSCNLSFIARWHSVTCRAQHCEWAASFRRPHANISQRFFKTSISLVRLCNQVTKLLNEMGYRIWGIRAWFGQTEWHNSWTFCISCLWAKLYDKRPAVTMQLFLCNEWSQHLSLIPKFYRLTSRASECACTFSWRILCWRATLDGSLKDVMDICFISCIKSRSCLISKWGCRMWMHWIERITHIMQCCI